MAAIRECAYVSRLCVCVFGARVRPFCSARLYFGVVVVLVRVFFSFVIISYVLFWIPTRQCTSYLLLLFWYLRCRLLVLDGNIFHYFIWILFHRDVHSFIQPIFVCCFYSRGRASPKTNMLFLLLFGLGRQNIFERRRKAIRIEIINPELCVKMCNEFTPEPSFSSRSRIFWCVWFRRQLTTLFSEWRNFISSTFHEIPLNSKFSFRRIVVEFLYMQPWTDASRRECDKRIWRDFSVFVIALNKHY